jgi:lipooligosaccharide transport system permease protein
MVIVTGFFEPLFYLLSIGFGLGKMVPRVEGVTYAAFLMPALLAISCLNGAITDGFFNIFFKLHYQKTYDGILATPMRVPDVAFGEMLWALLRGAIYAAGFLIVVLLLQRLTGMQMILSRWALLAWPAAVIVSASFSSFALCLTSLARRIQDLDLVMGLVIMPMFLFNGTFFPVSQLPTWLQWVTSAVPLYHAVALLRQLTTGAIDRSIGAHLLYLLLFGLVSLYVAFRRLEGALIK